VIGPLGRFQGLDDSDGAEGLAVDRGVAFARRVKGRLGPQMTLGNMRANGVRPLTVWCFGRGCNHHSILDVSNYPDDVSVPSFGPRFRCERCGHIGADARPNWGEARASGT
jgi:hypothetical protein